VEAFHKHIGIDRNSIRALVSHFHHHEEMLDANGLGNRASNRRGVMLIHVTRHAQYFGNLRRLLEQQHRLRQTKHLRQSQLLQEKRTARSANHQQATTLVGRNLFQQDQKCLKESNGNILNYAFNVVNENEQQRRLVGIQKGFVDDLAFRGIGLSDHIIGRIMRTNGNPESTATLAATAVVPEFMGPCNTTLMSGVYSERETENFRRMHLVRRQVNNVTTSV